MTFHVGQKVVCINGSFSDPRWKDLLNLGVILPQKDAVYTIRRFFPRVEWLSGDVLPGIYLHELINPEIAWMQPTEIPFFVRRFRPLIEKKRSTDVSFALDILDRANRQIREPV